MKDRQEAEDKARAIKYETKMALTSGESLNMIVRRFLFDDLLDENFGKNSETCDRHLQLFVQLLESIFAAICD